jgi:hypothetical protein
MRPFETCKSAASEFNAGKYMFEETALKNPPHDAINTIKRFWFFVNTECSGAAEDAVVSVGLASEVASSFEVGILSRGPSCGGWCCDEAASWSDSDVLEWMLLSS